MKLQQTILKFLLPVLVLAFGVGGFSYLKASRPERPQPKPKEKVWQVTVIEAARQAIAPSLTLYGETETPALLQAASPGAGLVTEILVRKGDRVRQGQRLLHVPGLQEPTVPGLPSCRALVEWGRDLSR